MDSRERVNAVLNGEMPDYMPVFPKIAFANVIACENMSIREYMTDGGNMAEACIAAYRTFGWDGVSLHTDIGSEGAALGSKYIQPENSPSELNEYLMSSLEEIDKIKMVNPHDVYPMKVVIDAVKKVKKVIGDEAYVLAWTNSPLNIASQLLKLDNLLVSLITEPELVHPVLEKCLEVAKRYAVCLLEAGADAIAYGNATCSSSVISPAAYRIFSLPYEKQLTAEIQKNGGKAVTHICGNILPIIKDIAENGADVIDFDHVCPVKELVEILPNKVFRGNIDPALLAYGTVDEVYKKTTELIDESGMSKKLLIGSGCEIPVITPKENLHALVRAARDNGRLIH